MSILQRMTQLITVLVAVFYISACSGEKRPDTIYIGGRIYTGNPEAPIAEAVGTIKARIVYVGDANGIVGDTHPTTKLVDLNGQVMYPGLINTHTGALVEGLDDTAGSQIEAAAIEYAKMGWTTLHAFNVVPENVRIMEDLAMSGKLPVRIYNVLNQAGFESLVSYGPGVSPGGLVETRTVLIDTAQPFDQFVETGETPSLEEAMKLALKSHVQLVFKVQTIEFDQLLDNIEIAFHDALPDADPRWRILADDALSPALIERAKSLGLEVERSGELKFEDIFSKDTKLENYTTGAAYIGFRQDMIGSIEVGKLADFTIMNGDLFAAASESDAANDIRPVMTIIGGAQAWPRPEKSLPVFGQ